MSDPASTASWASIEVHHDPECWWATCPACPGFSAWADSWDELFRLVSEHHASPVAKHRSWVMIQPEWSPGQ